MADIADLPTRELSPELVRERFRQARRDGHAAWLWPDIDIEGWRIAVGEIAGIARGILAGKSNLVLACGDAETMGLAGYTSGMGPLLGYWIENGMVAATRPVAEVFRLHLSHNRERMSRLSQVAATVVEKLAAEDISPLIFKGMHTAFGYFPEPGARPLSDIDIYVPGKVMFAAERVFSDLGYRRIPRTRSPYACDWIVPSLRREPHTLTCVHRDDPWSFDVQGSLNRRLLTGSEIKLDEALASSRTAPWSVCGKGQVMRQPLLALHLAAHASQTLLNATLLRATELVLVIRRDRATGELDWQEFLQGAVSIGGGRFVYPALAFCEDLAPGTIPADVLTVCKVDAPANLQKIVARLTVGSAQSLDRHSVSERFMWASNWRERIKQVVGELVLDGRGKPLGQTLYSVGTKLWAFRRRRYMA